MLQLQRECFRDVPAAEVEEDFCRPPVASVLASSREVLVACAEVFQREIVYKERMMTIGGFSPCTREDWRGRGIATAVCRRAMDYLKEQGGALLFLSVDTKYDAHPLYERLGFKKLQRPFIYANVRGELKESDGGMVAPLCAPELFEYVWRGNVPLSLAPEAGYW